MKEVMDELNSFLQEYEEATNSHVFNKVRPFISKDAKYWFSDGSHIGIKQIEDAFVKTFNKIKDETYRIRDVEWIILERDSAVCVYSFFWKGVVGGKLQEGYGRGTNVLSKKDGSWVIIHEHLSKI